MNNLVLGFVTVFDPDFIRLILWGIGFIIGVLVLFIILWIICGLITSIYKNMFKIIKGRFKKEKKNEL